MPTFASIAPAAAAALLWQPDAGEGYYRCEDSVRWAEHHQATATAHFAAGYQERTLTSFRFDRAAAAGEAFTVSANWRQLPRDAQSLPPPDELGFGMKTNARLQGGTILLIPPEGEILQLPVRKHAVKYLKGFGTTWVTITDAAQRAALFERGGWRAAAIDSSGRVGAQVAIGLPDRAGMEIRYRPLAESLRAKAAAYQTACEFEPVTESR